MQNNHSAVNHSDEVDLLEILTALWQQKLLIVATTIVVTLLAALYAFLSTPEYESKYYVSPPTVNDVANLNYGRSRGSDLKPFTVEDVYKVFLRGLQSESLRRSFFEQVYLPSLKDDAVQVPHRILYDRFSRSVTIAMVDKDEMGRWSLALQDSSAENSKIWVAQYVNLAGEAAKQELIHNAVKESSILRRNLGLQIDMLRESGKKLRQDSISQLREALAVARASGLQNSVVFTGAGRSELAGNMAGGSAYLRGSKALEAELKNLESRESDDPFTPGLRKLQKEHDFYKGLEAGTYDIAVFRQDGVLDDPVAPVKPKKALILILGVVVGGLLGSIIALIRSFILKRRKGTGLSGTVSP